MVPGAAPFLDWIHRRHGLSGVLLLLAAAWGFGTYLQSEYEIRQLRRRIAELEACDPRNFKTWPLEALEIERARLIADLPEDPNWNPCRLGKSAGR